MTELREGWTVVLAFPEGESIVSMCTYLGVMYVATTKSVYVQHKPESPEARFYPLEFAVPPR